MISVYIHLKIAVFGKSVICLFYLRRCLFLGGGSNGDTKALLEILYNEIYECKLISLDETKTKCMWLFQKYTIPLNSLPVFPSKWDAKKAIEGTV